MILDGIVLVFLVLSAYFGYKKGFSSIVISLIGFILAIVLAFMFKSTLANVIIEKTDADVFINEIVYNSLNNAIESEELNSKESNNSFYEGLIENIGAFEKVNDVSNNIVVFILETASFIIIFLVVKICAFIIQMMFNLVCELPILSNINSTLGLVVAIIMTLIKIWIILAIASISVPLFGEIKTLINSTVLTKILYDYNLLIKILSIGLKI